MTPSPQYSTPSPRGRAAGTWLPLLLLALGLLATAAAVWQTKRFIEREQIGQVESHGTLVRNDLRLHLFRHIDVLRAFQAELAAGDGTSPAALRRMAQVMKLEKFLPAIETIGYVRMTHDSDSQDDSLLLQRFYPETVQGLTDGAGWLDEPEFLEVVRRARDAGDIATVVPTLPPMLAVKDHVLLIYLPLYRNGLVPETREARLREFEGVLYMAVCATRLLDAIFNRHLTHDTYLQLNFKGYTDEQSRLTPVTLYDNGLASDPKPLASTRLPLDIGASSWSLDIGIGKHEAARSQRWLPWVVMAAGIALSLLVALALALVLRAQYRSQQQAKRDRCRRRAAEAALHLRERAIEASANAIVIANATEPGYPVEYVNPAFERMTGYSAQEIIGQSLRVMHGADTQQEGLEILQDILQNQVEGETTLRNYRKDGELYWTRVHIAPVRDESGVVTHFVAAKYDITENRRNQEELEFQAWHDALTGLPNRHMLRECLAQALRNRKPGDPPFWVAFLDLDNFKLVNDTLGHTLGDQVLMQVAKRLKEAVHGEDIVARRGGDEFVFILFDHEAPRNAQAALHRIITAISRPLTLESQSFYPSCSIGIAVHPQDGDDTETLIKRADMAMYHAKKQGRNNYQFYSTTLQEEAIERVRMEGALRLALSKGDFELHYQPQVRLSDGALTGMEALVRWQHPEFGLVPPDQFIPLAEETGLILPLGEWILRTACRQAAEWLRKGHPPLRVAVNLSALQFNDAHLPDYIRRVLSDYELPAECLELELTETLLMDDVQAASTILQTLAALGVTLSLDDFGTGYSSLAQLKRYPLHIIKIDRSFVCDISPEEGGAIVRTIIKLAHNLGMTVIAEGVETPLQADFLRSHQCDAIQGYFVSKPLSAADFETWMQDFHARKGHDL